MTIDDLPARLRNLLNLNETRYVVLLTNEQQTRIFDAREISLSEMLAILEANGLLPGEAPSSQVDE